MTTLSEDREVMTSLEAKVTMSSMECNQQRAVLTVSALILIQTTKLMVKKEMT